MKSRRSKLVLAEMLPPWLFHRLRNAYRKRLRASGKHSEVYISGWPQARRVNGGRKFECRPNYVDGVTFKQMFTDQEYNLGHLPRGEELLGWYRDLEGKPPLILDCGANIGASAVFLAESYPSAQIVSVEPDAENFALLSRNVTGYTRVKPVQAAVAAEDGWIRIVNPDGDPNSFQTERCDEGEGAIRALSIPTLIGMGGGEPFFLKVDIEGGESDLFSRHHEVLHRFPVVAVEIHDWLYPRRGTSKNFLEWHLGADRDFLIHHEMLYSIANDWTPGK